MNLMNRTMRKSLIPAVISILVSMSAIAHGAGDDRVNVVLDCRCSDSVGQELCESAKAGILKSAQFHLQDAIRDYGVAIHASCTDAWTGINASLIGHMSAVSLAFTIYAEDLPGEVYLDSSVTRVGKDAVDEMTAKIIDALGQQVKVNVKFFDRERVVAAYKSQVSQAASAPSPSPTPSPTPSP
jgi:hypothetical protein